MKERIERNLVIIFCIMFLFGINGFTEKSLGENTTKKYNIYAVSKSLKLKVNKIVDGDTIYVNYKNGIKKIRLLGIDTPESVSPKKDKNTAFGKKVSKYVNKKLKGKTVKLVFDGQKSDVYGRWLCYVYLGKTFFNKKLIELGYANCLYISPNKKYKKVLKKAEVRARKNKKGMWKYISYKTNENNFEYIGTSSSKKVHLISCTYAKNIAMSNRIYFKSLDTATASGYKNCKVCLRSDNSPA